MNYFCTLFDSNYLTRGLAMYHSLVEVNEQFELFIVCFDELAFDILSKLNLKNITIISLNAFENVHLLKVKQTRTKGEYCWTCTSHVIRYVLDNFQLPEVTYLDADLYFFNKPAILLDEFKSSKKDVMITEHRYTPDCDQTVTAGIYCVQFMTFLNNANSIKVLQWWQDRCLEWCFDRHEDGKFGDQKYLDDWLIRFDCVHVLENVGGGVAPWNIQQYTIEKGPKVNKSDVVFYHFHNLKWLSIHCFDMGMYRLQNQAVDYIYSPYLQTLQDTLRTVQEQWDTSFLGGIQKEKSHWKNVVRKYRRKWSGIYNVIQR